METQLTTLTQNAVQALKDADYNESTINEYLKTFRFLLQMAENMNTDCYTPELAQKFLADTANFRTGKYSLYRDKRHKRCIRMLDWYEHNGYFRLDAFTDTQISKPGTIDFQTLHSSYLRYLSDKGLANNTIDTFRNISCKFLLYLETAGYPGLAAAPATVVLDFVAAIRNTWSEGSLRTALSGLRSFFTFTGNRNLLNAVPGKALRTRKIIPVLTEAENQSLWNTLLHDSSISCRDKAIVALCLVTGLRACDIIGLQLSDINWRTDSISIIQQKTGKPLSLPLMPVIGNALAKYIIEERPESDTHYVFLSLQAPYRPLCSHSACYLIIKRTFRLTGIPLDGRILWIKTFTS